MHEKNGLLFSLLNRGKPMRGTGIRIQWSMCLSLLEIFLIALALAVDAFTVGVAVGVTHQSSRQMFRLSFHFGLFQALLPLLGAFVGSWLGRFMANYTHFVVFGLLSLVGGKIIYESICGTDDDFSDDPTRGWRLIALSIAVSIDALAVGFTLGLEEVSILVVVSVIGVVAAACTLIGMKVASGLASKVGARMEPLAGVVLIGLGLKAIIEYYM